MKPHLLTAGFALVISVSGFIFSQLRSHQTPTSVSSAASGLVGGAGDGAEGRRTEEGGEEVLILISFLFF